MGLTVQSTLTARWDAVPLTQMRWPSGDTWAEILDDKGCLTCRVVGTGAFFTVAAYMEHLRRGAPKAETTNRRFLGASAACFCALGFVRASGYKPFGERDD